MADEIEKINSKYREAIQKFIEAKIENPKLSVRTFCKAEGVPYQSFSKILVKYPQIMERILDGIRERYHSRSIEIEEALYQKALKGDTRAIELWYRKLEAWSPNQPEGGTTIRIIFGPGFPDEEVIEVKKVGPTEIVGDEKGGPAFELPEENGD